MRVKFLVTPVGLMMGNVESAKRLKAALMSQGIDVTTDGEASDYDLLHVHTPVPPSNATIVKKAKRDGIPVVMHAHTTVEDSVGTWTGSQTLSSFTGKYLTSFYNLADLVIAPSRWTRTTLQARGVSPPIKVLSNGIDLERFRFDPARRDRFRSRYGIPEDAVVAYSVGVVCVKKGVETIPEVAGELPELRFVWVGRRSMLYHPIRVRNSMNRCPSNVQFLHDVDNILDAHCGCDMFFTPSLVENQGMAVMEAMATERPVVARDLPSYEGLLEHGESAMICHSDSEFVNALGRLRADSDLTSRLVEGALASVSKHDIVTVARELATTYDRLVSGETPVDV